MPERERDGGVGLEFTWGELHVIHYIFWGKNEYLVLISKVKKSGKLYTLVACPKVHGVGEKELSPPLLVRVTQEELPTPFLLVKHIWWGEESVVHLFVHH